MTENLGERLNRLNQEASAIHTEIASARRAEMKRILLGAIQRSLGAVTIDQVAETCLTAIEEANVSHQYVGALDWLTIHELTQRCADPSKRIAVLRT